LVQPRGAEQQSSAHDNQRDSYAPSHKSALSLFPAWPVLFSNNRDSFGSVNRNSRAHTWKRKQVIILAQAQQLLWVTEIEPNLRA
jgi:hypothetical protein